MINPKHPIPINTADFNKNAHHYFAWMREHSPVYKTKFMYKPAYLLTQYDDVASALKDPCILKNVKHSQKASGKGDFWVPSVFRPLLHNMLNMDDPDHRRLRTLVQKAFTPKMIANLESRINSIAHELLDHAENKGGTIDLIEAFALPLPVTVIAEMIGIPKEDRPRFMRWVSAFVMNPSIINLTKAIPPVMAFMRYTRKLAAQRRQAPQDDLITALAQIEEDGDRLSEDELLGMIFLLVVAGHETTVNLIANGTLALLNNPDQLALLRSDFGMMETAVEELLRYDGPLHHTEMCFTTEERTYHNTTIPKGALVLPCLLSANRDERVFTNPDQLDITRTSNKHLAFGHGIHYCLGAPLARLEAKVAFCTLLDRFPNLQLAVKPDQLAYQSIIMLHRLKTLPIRLG